MATSRLSALALSCHAAWSRPHLHLASLKSCANTPGHLLPAQPAPTPFQGHLGPFPLTTFLLPFGTDSWILILQFDLWNSLRALAGTYLLAPPAPTGLWVDTLPYPYPWTSALALVLSCWGPSWNTGAQISLCIPWSSTASTTSFCSPVFGLERPYWHGTEKPECQVWSQSVETNRLRSKKLHK